MNGPEPLFHATSALSVDGMPDGWTARTLHLSRPDGTVETVAPLVSYMKEHPLRSATWQDTVVRGLGLLWDFSQVCGPSIINRAHLEQRNAQRMLYKEFAHALVTGTISNGEDPSGLYWPPTPLHRAKELAAAAEKFAAWYHEEYIVHGENRLQPISREFEADQPLNFVDNIVWGRMRGLSMLRHLRTTPVKIKCEPVADTGPDTRGPSAEPVKFFPPEHVERLLWHGHLRSGNRHQPNEFLQYSVRDQMILLLDGFGGLRHSEGLHFWVQDVVEEPSKTGHALVVINHPSEAAIEYTNRVTGRSISATRERVLDEFFGLRPRHAVKRSAYHAGWKGMDLNKQHQSFVYWLDDTAATLFWTLYLGYLRYVRGPIMEQRLLRGGYDHPFLFVSEADPGGSDSNWMIGDPYSPKAHARNHEAAVRRLGLPHGKSHGTTTQGLRHLYGQTLMNLGVPAQVIKKGLHHRQFLSQVPYTMPTREMINAQLNAARARQDGEEISMPLLGHDSSRALLRLHHRITAGPFHE